MKPGVSRIALCVFFLIGGILHFTMPRFYTDIMPPWLPSHLALVYVSGVCEMLGGLGVLHPASRAAAGWGLLALLIAVFPANIQMLMNAHRDHASLGYQMLLVARLPLQPLVMYWVYASAIRRS